MKVRALLASAAMVAGGSIAAVGTSAAPASADAPCAPLQVVGAPGTGYELIYSAPTTLPGGGTANLPSGIDFTKPDVLIGQVAAKLQPERDAGRITYQQVPYPADIGITMSYRKSVRLGTKATKAYIAVKARQCPGSRFALIGFSQGARVAGNVLHSIGQGNGPIRPDRLAVGGLWADPGRTQNDQLVGPAVPGKGIDRMRKGGFGAVNSRTFSVCAPGDIYCSADDSTLLRELVRKFGKSALADTSIIRQGLRMIQRNGFDLQKWSRAFGEKNVMTLIPKAIKTGLEIDRFIREGSHGHYLVGNTISVDGQSSIDWMTDRLREAAR
ncbi:cutinase family protein [Solicola gregarius]|uniref:Cutinase family protein n=1 Tax=Solicola gregarius TaxID=2908642 RepID=A0AA46TLG5_9ACTN|nr:cutinase family protein [Solicola gregarius]UYM07456.1 cutinase family protein [Solicola gregarius]